METVDENNPQKDLVTKKPNWLGRFLCKHGFHSWVILWMSDPRMVSVERWTINICTIGEKCRRPDCRIRRTRKNAKIPKKVRT